MKFYLFLERKLGKYAIKNLNLYLVVINLLGLAIYVLNPFFYTLYLSLSPYSVLKGQVWRIFTFIFYPMTLSSFGILFSLFIIYIYYNFTTSLINVWGDFKFNLYILIGIIGHVVAAFLIYFITGQDLIMIPMYLTFSIFIAFALTFKDAVFLVFFIIPVKAKYLAYFELIVYFLLFISSDMTTKISILVSLLNVFLFLYISYKDDFVRWLRRLVYKFFRR